MAPRHSLSRMQSGSSTTSRLWKRVACLFVLTFLANVAPVRAQDSDKRIEEIRRLYKQVNEQIAASEKEKPYSGIFLDELVLNRNDNPWPAVGIFNSVIKAYYTFSHEEGEPYPNRLLQITVTTKRSDRSEYAEYLFNPTGQLVFYFEKNDGDPTVEWRYYFANGRPIRIMRDQKIVPLAPGAELKAARKAIEEGLRLKGIFRLGQS